MQVENYSDFASRHREFLLLSWSNNKLDWGPTRFSEDGQSLQFLRAIGNANVFKVTRLNDRSFVGAHASPAFHR
jgi:hypothetical protein